MSSKFVLSEDERNALMEQVYGGFVRSPAMRTWGRGSEFEPTHRDGGKIDYLAYGGESKNYYDNRAIDAIEYAKRKGHKPNYEGQKEYYGAAYRNRDTWKKVSDHLGIDKVDSETDLRQMYDFVQGIGKEEDDDDKYEYTPTPLPEDPYASGGRGGRGGRRPGFGGERGNVPGSIGYKPPSDDSELGRAISSVADYGNRGTDDYFGRFLPEMGQRNVNEAKATGRSLLSNIQKFQGKVPELGDPKELFNFYLGKIKDD